MATIELDVRGLQAPEPLERVLETLDRIGPGDQLLLKINCHPVPLFRILERNGYVYDERLRNRDLSGQRRARPRRRGRGIDRRRQRNGLLERLGLEQRRWHAGVECLDPRLPAGMRIRLTLGAAHQQRIRVRGDQKRVHARHVVGVRDGDDAKTRAAERIDQFRERMRDAAHAHPLP
jgi:hypothetical protein